MKCYGTANEFISIKHGVRNWLCFQKQSKTFWKTIGIIFKECYELLKLTWDENKIEFVEQFKVILMNRAQRVLGIYELSTGGVTGTVADPKLVFTAALKANACNIILSHNHPSGNLKPSRADEGLTKNCNYWNLSGCKGDRSHHSYQWRVLFFCWWGITLRY